MSEPDHVDRVRAESFGAVAEAYDRFRPGYPDAFLDDLARLTSGEGAAVLDVGCGTGKLAAGLVERGLHVLGVEPDPQMAGVARDHGVEVEVATFEQWAAGGRCFDLVTCAQAWHWIDPAVAIPTVARLLRPGGVLVLCWNYALPLPFRDELIEVYARLAPEIDMATESVDDDPHRPPLVASQLFTGVHTRDYRWTERLTAETWIGRYATYSSHIRLPEDRRVRLLDGVREVLSRHEPFDAPQGTYAVVARTSGEDQDARAAVR